MLKAARSTPRGNWLDVVVSETHLGTIMPFGGLDCTSIVDGLALKGRMVTML